jgi:hypothetical protein
VQQGIKSSLSQSLIGVIYADEFMIKAQEKNKRGRSQGLTKLATLAVAILEDGVRRALAEVIEHSFATELGAFFREIYFKRSHYNY